MPVYLLHRYQAEAAVKPHRRSELCLRRVRGDGAADQRAAFLRRPSVPPWLAVAQTWQPAFLTLPDKVIAAVAPLPPGYERDRELFDPHTGPDLRPAGGGGRLGQRGAGPPVQPATPFAHRRAERARQEHAVFGGGVRRGAKDRGRSTTRQSPYEQELARMVEREGLEHLFRVAASVEAQQQVCAEALRRIHALQRRRSPVALLLTRTTKPSATTSSSTSRTSCATPRSTPLRRPPGYPTARPIGCGAAGVLECPR